MKKLVKRATSLILSIALCFSTCVVVNAEGVDLELVLDANSAVEGSLPSTLSMTIQTAEELSIMTFGGEVSVSDPRITIQSFQEEDRELTASEIGTGRFARTTGTDRATQKWVTVVFSVPADLEAGTYTITLSEIKCASTTNNSVLGDLTEKTVDFIVTSAPTGYTAGVSVTGNEVTIGNTVTVNVGVSHADLANNSAFNAAELKLNYDGTKLTPKTVYSEGSEQLKYTTTNGDTDDAVLTIEDFGGEKTFRTDRYVITFDTKAIGAATVTLSSAKFVHKDNAVSSDLVTATVSPASVEIEIKQLTFDVELPNDGQITGIEKATKGQDYVFTAANAANWNYTVTVTVDGNVIDTVTDDGNGNYTIPGESVTGPIKISYTRTGKNHTVTTNTVFGETTTPETGSAIYNTPYSFTLPDDVEPGLQVGYKYVLTSVTIGGNPYMDYTVEGRTYTIPGAAITGDIVITITKTEQAINTFTVGVEGTGAGNATVNNEKGEVSKEGTASITLAPETGYIYTVTAKMGTADATVTPDGNTYKVTDVTANVVFTVTKTLDVSSVAVSNYTRMNGTSAWLVIYDGTLADGKVPTYNSNVMYWSDKYDAYCYLVIASSLDLEAAKGKVGAVQGEKVSVNYGMDINSTGIIDAADAQVVYNIYVATYSSFDSVSMQKFLAADQNAVSTDTGTWKVTVEDAVVIINAILSGTAQ